VTAITLTHKIRLDPTYQQERYFRQACGVARFTWNWGLSEWKRQFTCGGKPSGLKLKKEFNAIKPVEYPWTYDVTKYASQQPFIFLQSAFRRFFSKQANYPRFKRKGVHDSFYIGNDHFRLSGKKIRIPRLGWVRMREALRFTGRVVSATVSRIADKWFVSLNVELDRPPASCESQAGVGVDLGVRMLATLFDGKCVMEVEGPRPLGKLLRKLRRLQRQLSRKEKGSRNRGKARTRVARLHYLIACIRQDGLHKLTSFLTANYKSIVIEDLNVKDMMGNRRLARAISDMGFHEFRRQLEYKAKMHGNHVELAYRWFPSSKRCSWCCIVNDDLTLSDRVFVCRHCGRIMDRDLNAAINLFSFSTVSSTGFEACGEEGAGSRATSSETGLNEAGTMPCLDLNTF
jgi:putative transposase